MNFTRLNPVIRSASLYERINNTEVCVGYDCRVIYMISGDLSATVDGVKLGLTVYKIDGSNYFKLRDLGKALDFFVGYDPASGVTISGESGYTD